jgi:hypothetical protein
MGHRHREREGIGPPALLDGVPRLGDAAVRVDPHRHEAH